MVSKIEIRKQIHEVYEAPLCGIQNSEREKLEQWKVPLTKVELKDGNTKQKYDGAVANLQQLIDLQYQSLKRHHMLTSGDRTCCQVHSWTSVSPGEDGVEPGLRQSVE